MKQHAWACLGYVIVMFSFAGAGDQRASLPICHGYVPKARHPASDQRWNLPEHLFLLVGIHMQTLTQPQTQHGCTLQSIDYRAHQRDEEQTLDDGDDEPLRT
jgi:hypothetical protein